MNPLFISIAITVLLTSCHSLHVTPTHSTPHFTKKHQAEISAGAGLCGLNANISYSPVKYGLLTYGGLYYPNPRDKGSYFNNNTEFGAGGYMFYKWALTGITAGYGFGGARILKVSADLLWWGFDDTEYMVLYKKFYINPYLSFRFNEETSLALSTKINLFDNTFKKVNYPEPHVPESYLRKYRFSSSTEICTNFKFPIYKKLSGSCIAGITFHNNHIYSQADIITRIGFCYQIN